jgi:hypothetical protein
MPFSPSLHIQEYLASLATSTTSDFSPWLKCKRCFLKAYYIFWNKNFPHRGTPQAVRKL